MAEEQNVTDPLLNPQPAPVGGEGDLWAEAILRVRQMKSRMQNKDPARTAAMEKVLTLCEQRRQQGIEKYGCPLSRGNGRDFKADLIQELLDALVYSFGGAGLSPQKAAMFQGNITGLIAVLLMDEE